jgi:hypothetical protein
MRHLTLFILWINCWGTISTKLYKSVKLFCHSLDWNQIESLWIHVVKLLNEAVKG